MQYIGSMAILPIVQCHLLGSIFDANQAAHIAGDSSNHSILHVYIRIYQHSTDFKYMFVVIALTNVYLAAILPCSTAV